ncbi:S8 family peptidase [Paenibacillus sp.]|jgi:subtilisin family serine protease|uniref:S8 family peptidase n=1 Tax=Paenibacillus sp. TaxID=58172 RepID=UPI002832DF27|nr:S8 family peptidase [Paenibacillus sp.]MDR0270203.1 S8 family peptidase [Paenibacillus sp.]
MDYTGLIQMLLEDMESPAPFGAKRILTFVNPRHYESFQHTLQELKALHPEWPDLPSSHLLKTVMTPLSGSGKYLDPYKNDILIEEDSLVKVHMLTNKANQGPGIPYGVKQIQAPKAWSISTGYRIKIGVIDTGADFYHPDLRQSLAKGINLLNRHMLPFDDNGHGTHIAGTIAAANGTEGMIGVAPRATIYPVKAFDHNGSAYVSDIIQGIDWCIRNKMNLINMSFGMKTRSKALLDIVTKAYVSGISIIASSGNEGKRRNIDYPAKYPQTISIGATDRNRRIASFSNRGEFIDIYAPGDKIISSWTHGKYHEMSGTSMATSHVSGAIALLLAQNPDLQPAEIKALLQQTATPLKNKKGQRRSSEGLEVNALKLLKEGMKKKPPKP